MQEGLELVRTRRLAQLAHRLGFDLANPHQPVGHAGAVLDHGEPRRQLFRRGVGQGVTAAPPGRGRFGRAKARGPVDRGRTAYLAGHVELLATSSSVWSFDISTP